MFRRSLIIFGLLVTTIASYGNPLFERSITPREQSPKNLVTEEGEEVCGDMAEAHHILISKESMSLKLYDKDGLLICRFPVSLGRHYGDKQELGDCKTPEGDFSIVQIQRASHWMYNDGKESIKGYYGNWFIRLNTKYSGIGIHALVDADEVHAHLAGDDSGDLVAVGQLNLEHGVGKGFNDLAFHFDDVALGHCQSSLLSASTGVDGLLISSPFSRR